MSAEDRVRLEAYADRMMQRVRHEGFDSTVRTGPEVRELLDAYAEMLA